jgi:putative ABC transport system substrate-binding protein
VQAVVTSANRARRDMGRLRYPPSHGHFVALAARYHGPAIYWSRSFTEIGGLISYGPYIVDEYRRAALYADRIRRGSKLSELPVQAPVKLEL